MEEMRKSKLEVGELGIVAMNGSHELASEVEQYIKDIRRDEKTHMIRTSFPRFGSGEAKGLIHETVRGKDIFILVDCFHYGVTYTMQGMTVPMSPDDHFQDLKRAISALCGKPRRINVIMPMLYAGRQHKRSARESLDCAVALQELQALGVKNILTFDAHDPRVQNAIPNSGFDSLSPTYQMIKTLIENEKDIRIDDENLMMISPDEGGVPRAMYYSSVLGVNLGMFYKRRNYAVIVDGKNPIEAHEYLGKEIKGKDVIISDDMISSGDSMLEVCEIVKKKGARRVYVFATFGLFCNGIEGFDEAYKKGNITKIFTTNLAYVRPEILQRDWYTQVDMSKYLAHLIDAINYDASISELIDPFVKIKTLLEETGNRKIG